MKKLILCMIVSLGPLACTDGKTTKDMSPNTSDLGRDMAKDHPVDADTDTSTPPEDQSTDLSDMTIPTDMTDMNSPISCDGVAMKGWSLCDSNATTCSFVFKDSTGCPQACKALGLKCVESHEDADDMCAINDTLPTLNCADTGHISDYCVCGEDDDPAPPSEVLAFPSARGAGAYATGGRGGRVIRVTTLANDGPGSLREALTATGKRIITFAVSGTIVLNSTIKVTNGDFTLAGQTAPAGGITLTGNNRVLIIEGAKNFIIRYLRVRPKYSTFDTVRLIDSANYIIDHSSVSWGGDELMSSTRRTEDVTFQRVLFAEGKTGSLFGDSNDPSLSKNLSFHHNAFYNVTHRHPNMHAFGRVDHYNNVIFNWRFRWSVLIGNVQANHINNYYARGCLSNVTGQNSFNKVFYNSNYTPSFYTAGNLVLPSFLTDPNEDNWKLWNWRVDVDSGPYQGAKANTQLTRDYKRAQPYPLLGPAETPQTAMAAYADVGSDVGANKRIDETGNVIVEQDTLDAMFLNNIRANACVEYVSSSQGQDFNTTQHYLDFHDNVSTEPKAMGYQDTNKDGIPDAWIKARGFGINDDMTAHVWPSGYVGVEEFLNEVDK